jgi:cell division protein FtsZ
MRIADGGIIELQKCVDTLLIIPNQNLFRVANEKTTFADAFALADQVLYSGVACITDLMVKEGLINLDFADVRAVMREMGKAMMGTGEAEGEKRAMRAAEAAISNPLIDDASMKGARGLLISITGGRDLTLYEVDEAATRIREEVDHDANIIVGATFDESLDGMIRVSVVATGIDQALAGRPSVPADSRIAEVAQRMRAENQRIVERIERPEAVRSPATAPIAIPASVNASIESAAKAAIAAAVEDVTIRPLAPKPSLFIDPAASEPEDRGPQDLEPAAFIPPQPERLPSRAPRMPRIDELPVPAQNEIRARRGELAQDEHPEKRRMSLLQRLASVGLGRREHDEQEPPQINRPMPASAPPPPTERLAGRAMPRPAEPRRELRQQDLRQQDLQQELPVSEYARRPAPQGLDQHGRQSPVHNPSEEDQLDIPAFLRRQAN